MTGGVWVASYVLLWVTVLVLCTVVVALLRQVGVLHTRLRPLGVHFAGEGPERLSPAPPVPRVDYAAQRLTLLAFTSPTCQVCATLLPGLRALERQYAEVRVVELLHGEPTVPVFQAFNVRSTPYLVTVDRHGLVQGRGVANSLEQAEVLLEESLSHA